MSTLCPEALPFELHRSLLRSRPRRDLGFLSQFRRLEEEDDRSNAMAAQNQTAGWDSLRLPKVEVGKLSRPRCILGTCHARPLPIGLQLPDYSWG
jgi:hypothetical protein